MHAPLTVRRPQAGEGTKEPLVSDNPSSIHERAAAILVDVDAHDLLERALGVEAELARAACLDALRPAVDDAGDQRVVRAANARGDALAGDAPQRRDLLGNGAAHAGHGEID